VDEEEVNNLRGILAEMQRIEDVLFAVGRIGLGTDLGKVKLRLDCCLLRIAENEMNES